MAIDYWTFTVAVHKDEIPPKFNSISDLTVQNAEDRPHCIGYSHRTPDLLNLLKTIVIAYNKQHIGYLTEPVATLDTERIRNAIDDFESLLIGFEKDQYRIMECVEQEWPEHKVIEALHLPAISNPQPAWDYGADLPYIIAYLKSHLAVLKTANMENLYVLHVQS